MSHIRPAPPRLINQKVTSLPAASHLLLQHGGDGETCHAANLLQTQGTNMDPSTIEGVLFRDGPFGEQS
jgi:hypothetical protein